jgi:beta-fructofuranosidase
LLTLPEHWVWDSWIADDGELFHLFFLQAERALADPDRRHTAARIGHATSTDLRDWTYHGVALDPGPAGAWDDLALWTGSVARGDDGLWRMFYTALNSRGRGVFDQRIGVAVSLDLFSWHRPDDRPAIEIDPGWYLTLADGAGVSETWRDPFVFRDPTGSGWCAYITARLPGAPRLDDGVLALATSPDLVHWRLQPPVTTPAGFGQLEVVQVRLIDGQHVLVFTCHPDEQTPLRRKQFGEFCTWSMIGASALGPWDVCTAQPFEVEPNLFAAPLVQDRRGVWNLVGFRNLDPGGDTRFEILDPIAVQVRDGRLVAC